MARTALQDASQQSLAKVRGPYRQPSCACRPFAIGIAEWFPTPPKRYSVCAQMDDKLSLRIRAVGVTLQVDFAAIAPDAFLSL